MDLILESNRSSVILSSLAKADVVDTSYFIEDSYPLLAKTYRKSAPTNPSTISAVVMNNQEISFNLNKSMLLRDALIKTSFTTTTTSMGAIYPGIKMFDTIQIKTNNKVLFNITDVGIKSWYEQQNGGVLSFLTRAALPLTDVTEVLNATSTAATHCYTYLPCSFFDSVRNNLDLNFYEQVTVTCRFSTPARAGFPTTVTLSNCDIWTWLWRPDDKYYDMLRSKNQNPSKPLNMLTWNTFTERYICTGLTQNTMRLNCNYPVFKTVIRLNPVTTALAGSEMKIDSFSFTVGGTEVITSAQKLVADLEKTRKGAASMICSSATALVRDDKQGVTIDWGMDPHDWTYNSGAVSFSQLNYPQFVVNHQTLTTAADYELSVVHFYFNVLTLDSTNGSIIISTSS